MKPILLDGVGAGILVFIFALGVLFIITVIFIEAVVLWKMKYHAAYSKALLHSTVANLLSLAAGIALVEIDSELFQLDNRGGLGLMFAVTLVVEGLLLYLMNRAAPLRQTIKVCFLMNLISYAIAVIIILTR